MNYPDLMQKAGKRINPKVYYFNDNEKIEYGYDDIISAKPFFNAKLVGTVMSYLIQQFILKIRLFMVKIQLLNYLVLIFCKKKRLLMQIVKHIVINCMIILLKQWSLINQ